MEFRSDLGEYGGGMEREWMEGGKGKELEGNGNGERGGVE